MARPHPDKMTFLEHLDELRQRLVRVALYLAGGFAVCWGFHEQIFHFLTQPLRRAGFTDQFIYTSPAEAFLLYMKMAFFVGIFVASPFVLWEIWAFISPGLYRNEKAWAVPFIGMGSLFFASGALFGHYVLFLNSDTRVPTGALSKLVEFMNARPDASACSPLPRLKPRRRSKTGSFSKRSTNVGMGAPSRSRSAPGF